MMPSQLFYPGCLLQGLFLLVPIPALLWIPVVYASHSSSGLCGMVIACAMRSFSTVTSTSQQFSTPFYVPPSPEVSGMWQCLGSFSMISAGERVLTVSCGQTSGALLNHIHSMVVKKAKNSEVERWCFRLKSTWRWRTSLLFSFPLKQPTW